MLLTSINEHVKDQNWFAVVLDFIIVVVGVFNGLAGPGVVDQSSGSYRRRHAMILRRVIAHLS